jgi:hypothetical protein
VEITVGRRVTGVLELELVGGGFGVVLGTGEEDEGGRLVLVSVALVLPRVGLIAWDAEVDIVDGKLVLGKPEEVPGVVGAEDIEVVELGVDPIPAPFVKEMLGVLVAVLAGVELSRVKLELEGSGSASSIVPLYTVTIMTSPSFSVVNCRFSISSVKDMEGEGGGTMTMPPHFCDGFPGQGVLHAESGYLI